MSLQLRNLFHLHRLMEEVVDGSGGGTGGGGGGDVTVDIDAASDQIGSELGLGGSDDDTKDLDAGSATPPAAKKPAAGPTGETPELKAAREARERATAAATPEAKAAAAKAVTEAKAALTAKKVDFAGKTDAEILELAKPAAAIKPLPKSWKKELGETWAKLPPEAQDYIEQREAQVANGFQQQASAVRYAEAIYNTLQPHEALLASQGIKNHVEFVNSLVNAHFVLSSQPDNARYPYIAQILASYGLDPAKVGEAYTALGTKPAAITKTAETVALEQRMAKMEQDRTAETRARFESLKAASAAEVEAFASDPKHPYFDEVASHVSLLLADPRITLADAYEQAVYANPVTRAKELTRLSKEAEEKTRTEAEAAAAAALKAKGTRVRGDEKHRGSPDLLGTIDDTLHSTYKDIQSRQE